MAANPEDDFGGYMDAQAQAANDQLEREAMMEQHRIWKQTTWGGFVVQQIQSFGDNFRPFFVAVVDAMRNQSGSSNIVVMVIIRLVVIGFAIGMVYLGAWLLQSFIGGEIIVEEEEIIVVDDDDDEGEEESSDETKKKK